MGQPQPLFLFSVFLNKQYNFYNRSILKSVISIQYTAPEIEPTTFWTWDASHNH